MTEQDRRDQFLRAYLRHRVGERLEHFDSAGTRYSAALGWTGTLATIMFAASALFAALGIADGAGRPRWAFLATTAAALAAAITGYEAAFGFRQLSRQYTNTVATLHLLRAHGPAPSDRTPSVDDGRLDAFVHEVETLLLNEVGTRPQAGAEASTEAEWDGAASTPLASNWPSYPEFG